MLRAQLDAAQCANTELRRLLDVTLAQLGAAQAETDELRAELAEAQASTEFYLDLFCLERARHGAQPGITEKAGFAARHTPQ